MGPAPWLHEVAARALAVTAGLAWAEADGRTATEVGDGVVEEIHEAIRDVYRGETGGGAEKMAVGAERNETETETGTGTGPVTGGTEAGVEAGG